MMDKWRARESNGRFRAVKNMLSDLISIFKTLVCFLFYK
jgi:hypothetical protein